MTGRFRYDPGEMPLEIAEVKSQIVTVVEVAGRSFDVLSLFQIRANGMPGVPYEVLLTIERKDRGFICTELFVKQRAGGPPVTLAGIRSIPVESWVRRGVRELQPFYENTASGKTPLQRGGPLGLPVAPRRRRTSKRRSRDEEKADVELAAVVYRLAEVGGEPPSKAVADQLRIPLGTARFLVARARARGLLEQPARPTA